VLAYLWPARDDEHARHSLAQLLYGMRRSLQRTMVAGDVEFRLDPESLTSDISEFLQASNDAARLSVLYVGSFLDGFHLSDAPLFDQWTERQRDRTANIFAAALETHARNAFAVGNHGVAIETWRRRVALGPFEPGPVIELMKALDASGDRPGAIRQARIYEDLIKSEDEMEGDPQITALADRIRNHETHGPVGPRTAALAAVAAVLWPHPKIPELLAVGDVTVLSPDGTSSGDFFSEILAQALVKLPGVNLLSPARTAEILAGSHHSKEQTLEVFQGAIHRTKGQFELALYRVDLRTGVTRRAYRASGADFLSLAKAAAGVVANDFGIVLD
jgi:DNA-binding SARP family transcriptional activator